MPAPFDPMPLRFRGSIAHAGNENRRVLHRGARLLRPGVPLQRAGASPDVSPPPRADGRAARREQRQPAVPVRGPGAAVSRQFHGRLRPAARGRRAAGEVARREVSGGPAAGPQGLRRRGLLALPQPVRPPGLERGSALGAGLADQGIPERAPAPGDVRHAPRRARPEPRGGPAVQRLARRPFLPADDALHGLAHARIPLVLRRLPRQAQRPRPGPDDLRPVARLVARELPLLRRLQAVGRIRPGEGEESRSPRDERHRPPEENDAARRSSPRSSSPW